MPLGGRAGDECKILSRFSATGGLSLCFSLQIIDFLQIYVQLIHLSVSVSPRRMVEQRVTSVWSTIPDDENRDDSRNFGLLAVQPTDSAVSPTKFH
jgi:hypothetical protein